MLGPVRYWCRDAAEPEPVSVAPWTPAYRRAVLQRVWLGLTVATTLLALLIMDALA